MMRVLLAAMAALSLAAPSLALAHSGGLDASGCHHDRKRDGYHCHRAQSPSRQTETRASGTTTAKSAMVACAIKDKQLMAYSALDCMAVGGKPQ